MPGILRGAVRELHAVARGDTAPHRHLRERLAVLLVTTVAMDLVCTVLAYLAERGAPRSDITDLGSALFWSSTQLLTVSSSFTNPISTGGRILDVVMEAYAIVVVGALAGALGTFFLHRSQERAAVEHA